MSNQSIKWPRLEEPKKSENAPPRTIQPMLIPQVMPIQPINVVVQQPRGWPIWATTLFSASVGAMLGIIGNVFMEYAKPWISKRSLRETITSNVNQELMLNLNVLEGAKFALAHIESDTPGFQSDHIDAVGTLLLEFMSSDRFDMHFSQHKTFIYEMDDRQQLIRLYQIIEGIRNIVKNRRWPTLKSAVGEGIKLTRGYCGDHGIEIVRVQTAIHGYFGLDEDGNCVPKKGIKVNEKGQHGGRHAGALAREPR